MTDRTEAVPLHERLETWGAGDDFAMHALIHHGHRLGDDLREAAAALRPPEGELGEAIKWAEEQVARREPGEDDPTILDWDEGARSALAHLRRLAAAEAERDRLRVALRDMACLSFGVSGKSALGVEQEFREMARAALAPAPAAEG